MPHSKLIQYQNRAQPVFVPPETITEDKWYSPWSTPVRKRISGTLAVALIASGITLTPVIPPSNPGSWHQPWPTAIKQNNLSTAQIASGQTFTPVVAEAPSGGETVYGSPVIYEIFDKRTIIYPAFQGPVAVTAETVTLDKWHQRWSEPVRVSARLSTGSQQSFSSPVRVVVPFGWNEHQSWSEPVYKKRSATLYASDGIIDPFPIPNPPVEATEASWHYGWSEPVRQKRDPRASSSLAASGGVPNPYPIPTVSGTGTAPDLPNVVEIFTKHQIIYPAHHEPVVFAVETITEDKWHQPWSQPVRTKPSLITGAQQAFFAPPRIIVSFGWNEPTSWADPVRKKPGIGAWLQQSFTFDPFPIPAGYVPATEASWHYPWSTPVRVKIDPRHAVALASSGNVLNPLPVVTFDWNEPSSWSDPVRLRPPLLTAQQQFTAKDPRPVELITEDKWHFPWSTPVRSLPSRFAGQQQFLATTLRTIETITEDKWHHPWTEPVRGKPGLGSWLQQSFTFDPYPIPSAYVPATEASWHYPWAEPVRFRVDPKVSVVLAASSGNSLDPYPLPPVSGTAPASIETAVSFRILGIKRIIYPAYQAPVPIVAETITEDKWHQGWSEPVRQKRDPKAAIALIASGNVLDPFPLPNPVTPATEASWHYPWSEPVRTRPGLLASQQQALIHVPRFVEIITLDKWYLAWAEPVRTRLGLLASEQQFLATTLRSLEIITEDKWHYPWSEPIRFKIDPRYRTAFAASGGVLYPFPLPPVVIVPEDRWHQPWSEPIRLKLGPRLREYLQQATTIPAEILTGGAISGILDATEAGDIFFAVGYVFNQPSDVNVGIIEIAPGSALVGIQFDRPTVSANVGIEASIQSASSGTVVGPSVSALVSIREV